MDHTLRAVGHGRGVLPHSLAAAERLNADELDRVVEEAGEDADRVRTAAHTGFDDVGQVAGHLDDCSGLHADDLLEVADMSGNGCGPTTERTE